jgi:hypothetical protein
MVFKNNGEQPPIGSVIRHLCGIALCCNPNHLEAGSQYENVQDKYRHGTVKFGDLHWRSQCSDKMREKIIQKRKTCSSLETAKQLNLSKDIVKSTERSFKRRKEVMETIEGCQNLGIQ